MLFSLLDPVFKNVVNLCMDEPLHQWNVLKKQPIMNVTADPWARGELVSFTALMTGCVWITKRKHWDECDMWSILTLNWLCASTITMNRRQNNAQRTIWHHINTWTLIKQSWGVFQKGASTNSEYLNHHHRWSADTIRHHGNRFNNRNKEQVTFPHWNWSRQAKTVTALQQLM